MTSQTSVGTITDWLVICAKNVQTGSLANTVLVDGVPKATGSAGAAQTSTLGINTCTSGVCGNDVSDYAFSQLIIWNETLSDSNMIQASSLLSQYLETGSYTLPGVQMYAANIPQPWVRNKI